MGVTAVPQVWCAQLLVRGDPSLAWSAALLLDGVSTLRPAQPLSVEDRCVSS